MPWPRKQVSAREDCSTTSRVKRRFLKQCWKDGCNVSRKLKRKKVESFNAGRHGKLRPTFSRRWGATVRRIGSVLHSWLLLRIIPNFLILHVKTIEDA